MNTPSITDLFPSNQEEQEKYPLLTEFMAWFIEDGVNLADREAVMSALETNIACVANASIVEELRNLQDAIISESTEQSLQLDNGNTIVAYLDNKDTE